MVPLSGTATPTPAPAPAVSPRVPFPPAAEALRRQAEAVGKEYGRFESDLETDFFLTFETPFTGGVPLWDRMNADERRKKLAKVQDELNKLPRLPTASNLTEVAAIREGFEAGANFTYETERFKFRAVWVACELAKAFVIGKASTPAVGRAVGIGSAFSSKFRDCAAQTAARIIREMTGVEVDAAYLIRTFGLPPQTLSSYEAAAAYARNWFESVGINLAPKSGGFYVGGDVGKYVIFFEGGPTGGHVVYGEVTTTGTLIIDNQSGKMWTSIIQAQNSLGMNARAAFRVEKVQIP